MLNKSRFIKSSAVTLGLLFSGALAVFATVGQSDLSKPVSVSLLDNENIPLSASVQTYAAGATLNQFSFTADEGDFDLQIKQDLYKRTVNSGSEQQSAAGAANAVQTAAPEQSVSSQPQMTAADTQTLAANPSNTAKTAASVEKPASYKFINANELNVRSGAGTDYDKVATLKRGEKVGIISTNGDWVKIQTSSGKTGYTISQYLVAKESQVEPEQPVAYWYVNADTLNVRSEANADSDKVTSLKRGDKVGFFAKDGDWTRIQTSSGKTGYALSKYLVEDEGSISRGSSSESRGATSSVTTTLAQQIADYSTRFVGVDYVYGGYSTKGFDCSGFVKYVYAHFGIDVPRSSADYAGFGVKVSRDALRPSDIILFDTDGGSWDVSHVGIYLGGDKFIHASTSHGSVVIQSLSDYRGKFYGARRVID